MLYMSWSKCKLWISVFAITFQTLCFSAMANEAELYSRHLFANPIELDELQNRAFINNVIYSKFFESDFESLEKIAREFAEKKLTTASGLSKLGQFNTAFLELFLITPEREASVRQPLQKLVDAWLQKYPESTSAHLAEASMLYQRGWSIRGQGYANTVSPEAWKSFYEHIEMARQYLQDNEKYRRNDPRWDYLELVIAMLQNLPEEEFVELYTAALDRNPDYYHLYFQTMMRYEPKWGGNFKEVEKIANHFLSRSKSAEGYAVYARVYWSVSQGYDLGHIFDASLPRWQTMKLGIDDVLKKYPDKWNIYNFAMFACHAKDLEKTRELLSLISNEQITSDWPHFEAYESCRVFAGLI